MTRVRGAAAVEELVAGLRQAQAPADATRSAGGSRSMLTRSGGMSVSGSGTGTPATSAANDYTTWAAVKTYLDISSSGDDALGADLVTRASRMIDRYCRRVFIAASATRTFDTPAGATLFLDEDLVSLTTLTNGDGTVIAGTDYVLLAKNITPKYAVRLRETASMGWLGSSTTGEFQAISVLGSWGYSASPPDDVVQAAVRLTAWIYRQRDAPFGQTARPEIGVIETPLSMPPDVVRILAPYVKVRVSGV